MDIYLQYELYKVRKIQCLFVIPINYIDFKRYEKNCRIISKNHKKCRNNLIIGEAAQLGTL